MKVRFFNDVHKTDYDYRIVSNYLSYREALHISHKLCGNKGCTCSDSRARYTRTEPPMTLEVDQGRAGCLYGFKVRFE